MSHDINNLNQVTVMSLEIIRDDPGLTPEEKESIETALNAAEGSAGIIKNVRTLQEITEQKLETETVDLNGMILDCIKEAPRPTGKTVDIRYAPKKDMLVTGVPLLKAVFCNLINNSIKYSGDQVTIDIIPEETLIQSKKYYRVAITDNGYGIPDDVKPKLFTRFQRGTTKAHGKGLGLYIVRTLVERFGGSVKLEDRVPGDYTRGSKFTVTLPAAGGKNE
jgi:signal transduction histidine kinase